MTDLHHPTATPTSPELKWLLNERAAVLGRLSKSRSRVESLDRSILRYEGLLSSAIASRSSAEQDVAEKMRTIEALDLSIALVDARIRPDAAGRVVPCDKYGGRGGLTRFLRETLRKASPSPVSGSELARLAIAHFNLALLTPPERRSFGYSVKTTLSVAIRRDGVVERLPKTQGRERTTMYRWKAPAGIDAVRAAIARLEEAEHGQAADPV